MLNDDPVGVSIRNVLYPARPPITQTWFRSVGIVKMISGVVAESGSSCIAGESVWIRGVCCFRNTEIGVKWF